MGWYNHTHLPKWIARSDFFQGVLLFRKLYLTKHVKYHYGQEAEDVALKRIITRGPDGFFVDVGCFHPRKYNNTYFLYKRGWRGVNVDIDPIKIKGFNWMRGEDVNVAKAVSTEKGEVEYWTNGFYSLVNTLEPASRDENYNFIRKTTPTDTLTNILDGTRFKDRKIDLLTIDAEGFDMNVLRSLDMERYQPNIIVMETNVGNLDGLLKSELYQYLKAREYDLVNWAGLSVIFKKHGR